MPSLRLRIEGQMDDRPVAGSRRAHIWWLPEVFGGRARVPPRGTVYTTVARYQDYESTEVPEALWSLRVRLLASMHSSRACVANVWPLAPEAPTDLLSVGKCFALLEGRRIVAVGRVV